MKNKTNNYTFLIIIFALILLGAVTAAIIFYNNITKKDILKIQAEKVVRQELSITGTVIAESLKGGLSQATLFTVTTNSQKYVVRFLTHKSEQKKQQEIEALTNASQAGYGPHVYYANGKQAVIVMEYLVPQKITFHNIESNYLENTLGNVLRQIHSSKNITKTIDVFNEIQKKINSNASYYSTIAFQKLENNLQIIQKAVAPYVQLKPCHNDLNPGNLIFLGDAFKAIDYETAAQADPYFDIATTAIFYPLNSRKLLTIYLARQPSPQEEARLYLMKQVAYINYAVIFCAINIEHANVYKILPKETYESFIQDFSRGKVNLVKPKDALRFAKIMINLALTNCESDKFKNALQSLKFNYTNK